MFDLSTACKNIFSHTYIDLTIIFRHHESSLNVWWANQSIVTFSNTEAKPRPTLLYCLENEICEIRSSVSVDIICTLVIRISNHSSFDVDKQTGHVLKIFHP